MPQTINRIVGGSRDLHERSGNSVVHLYEIKAGYCWNKPNNKD